MATGIVSIAAFSLGLNWIASSFFLVNEIVYPLLVFLLVTHIALNRSDPAKYVTGPAGTSLFTIVAGTCVFGSQCVVIRGGMTIGLVLWILGALLWVILIYAFISSTITREAKEAMQEFDGRWLILVVGTEAVAVLGADVASSFPRFESGLLFASLSLHLIGAMLYVVLIVLIVQKIFFLRLIPTDFTPSYWITMGAAAITSLAASSLIRIWRQSFLLGDILPFIGGMSLLFWAFATWWIPLLILLTLWKYLLRKVPYTYDVQKWSRVFPLGMYAFCTFQLGEVTGLEFLTTASRYLLYVALAAWLVAFNRLLRQALGAFSRP